MTTNHTDDEAQEAFEKYAITTDIDDDPYVAGLAAESAFHAGFNAALEYAKRGTFVLFPVTKETMDEMQEKEIYGIPAYIHIANNGCRVWPLPLPPAPTNGDDV